MRVFIPDTGNDEKMMMAPMALVKDVPMVGEEVDLMQLAMNIVATQPDSPQVIMMATNCDRFLIMKDVEWFMDESTTVNLCRSISMSAASQLGRPPEMAVFSLPQDEDRDILVYIIMPTKLVGLLISLTKGMVNGSDIDENTDVNPELLRQIRQMQSILFG